MEKLQHARQTLREHRQANRQQKKELEELQQIRKDCVKLEDVAKARSWRSPPQRAQEALIEVMRRYRVVLCTIIMDRRDAELGALAQLDIFLTAVPFGLTEDQQRVLATYPMVIPCEVLPFHAGSIQLIQA